MKICSFFLFISLSLFAYDKEERDRDLQNELSNSPSKNSEEVKTVNPKKEPINPVEERFRPKEEPSSLLWTLLKVFFIFGILTAVLYYVLKFLSKTKASLFPVKNALRILSSIPISPNKQIQILEVSGMLFVIGVSDGSISLIKEIDSPQIKEKIFQERDSFEPTQENFGEYLTKTFQNLDIKSSFNFQKKSEQVEDDFMDQIKQRQAERLNKMKIDRTNLDNKDKNENFFS